MWLLLTLLIMQVELVDHKHQILCSLLSPLRQSSRGYLPEKCYSFQPSCRANGGNTGHGVSAELLNFYLHHSQPGLLWLWVHTSSQVKTVVRLKLPTFFLYSVDCWVGHSYYHGLQHWNISHQHPCCAHAGCRERRVWKVHLNICSLNLNTVCKQKWKS